MPWSEIANDLWSVEWWKVSIIAAFYIVPVLRLVGAPLESGRRMFMRINRLSGIWEHAVHPVRDTIALAYLVCGAAWHIWIGAYSMAWQNFAASAVALALVASSFGFRALRRRAHLRLIDFVIPLPTIHPQEFFDHFLCSSGAIRHRLPPKPFMTIEPTEIDFRRRNEKKSVGTVALILGVWSTIWMTRLAIAAGRSRGREFMRRASSSIAVIWGTRICQLTRSALKMEGKENLLRSGGAQIYLFTHMSFIDFALVPLLLAARPNASGNPAAPNHLPLFLMAKDHFRDNWLFYRLLGLGRAAEEAGMIFVDRKASDRGAEARRVAKLAISGLVGHRDVLAIFPQGTRALPFFGPKGERRDAGYYTVGNRDRIMADGGHLKKGASHIAKAAADELAAIHSPEELSIIPIAITKTADACPRGSMRIVPNIAFELDIAEPIIVPPKSDAAQIHIKIDDSLKSAAHIHAELERRFFEEVRAMIEPMQMEEIALAMKPWRGSDFLVHAIIDAIYTCPIKKQRPLINELVHLMLNFATRDELLAFKGKVADSINL